MNWHFVSLDAVPAMPWRNGGGVTRELLAWPTAADWQVRISVADITQDGPFSSFPGVTRWFAVLEGEGVQLEVNGQAHTVRPGSAPVEFDGAAAVGARLPAGPTRDLNLMARGHVAGMARVQGSVVQPCRKGSLVAVYVHEGDAAFLAGDVRIPVAPRTLAWRQVSQDERFEWVCRQAWWMEVFP